MHQLLAPPLIILYVVILSTIAIQLRGRTRLGFKRQLTDVSTFTAPFNAFVYLFSAVPNRPVLEVARFPELAVLRRNWRTIRDEARALHEGGRIGQSDRHDDVYGNSLFKRGWRRFYVKWYGDVLPSAREWCPRTVALLETIPAVHAAMFTLVAPHSRLGKHRDPFASSLRYHLGLVTPNSEDCRIYVDGVPYAWRDGEAVVFDETYVHWVENDTDQPRIILFCDVERPMRGRLATAINRMVIRHVLPATAPRNVEGETLGALNRLMERVYPLHLASRRLKERSVGLYYCLKFGLLLGALYLLLVVSV